MYKKFRYDWITFMIAFIACGICIPLVSYILTATTLRNLCLPDRVALCEVMRIVCVVLYVIGGYFMLSAIDCAVNDSEDGLSVMSQLIPSLFLCLVVAVTFFACTINIRNVKDNHDPYAGEPCSKSAATAETNGDNSFIANGNSNTITVTYNQSEEKSSSHVSIVTIVLISLGSIILGMSLTVFGLWLLVKKFQKPKQLMLECKNK